MDIVNKNPQIYIIAGKARHGKNAVADIIKEHYQANGKKAIDIAYAYYIKQYAQKVSDWDGNEDTKPRSLLQAIGTDIIRKQIDYDFFANRMLQDITIYSYFVDAIIISDARYPDEIDTPKGAHPTAISIHVEKPDVVSDLSTTQQQHLSETGLDNYASYDYSIINDGDLNMLKEKVIKIIKEVTNGY